MQKVHPTKTMSMSGAFPIRLLDLWEGLELDFSTNENKFMFFFHFFILMSRLSFRLYFASLQNPQYALKQEHFSYDESYLVLRTI